MLGFTNSAEELNCPMLRIRSRSSLRSATLSVIFESRERTYSYTEDDGKTYNIGKT